MSVSQPDTCATCYGQGEVVTDQGTFLCRDCMGHGKLAGRLELFEWRLRELEQANQTSSHESAVDIRWLIAEVRRNRDALLQILARCQDAADDDVLAADVRYLANGCLGLYPVTKRPA